MARVCLLLMLCVLCLYVSEGRNIRSRLQNRHNEIVGSSHEEERPLVIFKRDIIDGRAKKRCESCLNSFPCKKRGKCELCKNSCDATAIAEATSTVSPIIVEPESFIAARFSEGAESPTEGNADDYEDIVGMSSSPNTEAEPTTPTTQAVPTSTPPDLADDYLANVIPKWSNRLFTVGVINPGEGMSNVIKLLKMDNSSNVEKLIVLAKMKRSWTKLPIPEVTDPIIIDAARVMSDSKSPLHRLGSSRDEIDSQLFKRVKQYLEEALTHKRNLSLQDINRIVDYALLTHMSKNMIDGDSVGDPLHTTEPETGDEVVACSQEELDDMMQTIQPSITNPNNDDVRSMMESASHLNPPVIEDGLDEEVGSPRDSSLSESVEANANADRRMRPFLRSQHRNAPSKESSDLRSRPLLSSRHRLSDSPKKSIITDHADLNDNSLVGSSMPATGDSATNVASRTREPSRHQDMGRSNLLSEPQSIAAQPSETSSNEEEFVNLLTYADKLGAPRSDLIPRLSDHRDSSTSDSLRQLAEEDPNHITNSEALLGSQHWETSNEDFVNLDNYVNRMEKIPGDLLRDAERSLLELTNVGHDNMRDSLVGDDQKFVFKDKDFLVGEDGIIPVRHDIESTGINEGQDDVIDHEEPNSIEKFEEAIDLLGNRNLPQNIDENTKELIKEYPAKVEVSDSITESQPKSSLRQALEQLAARRNERRQKVKIPHHISDDHPQEFSDEAVETLGQTLQPSVTNSAMMNDQNQEIPQKLIDGERNDSTDTAIEEIQKVGIPNRMNNDELQDFTDKTVERRPSLTSRRGNQARKKLLRNRINADQPQDFPDKTLVGQPQGFTDKTLVGQPQGFTDKTLVGLPQGFTDKTVVGFTDKTLVGQPQGFTDKTLVGQPQDFTDKTLVGQPQGFTDKTLVGKPQGFTDKTLVGQPKDFTDKTVERRPSLTSRRGNLARKKLLRNRINADQPQDFTDKTLVGQPQGFTDKTLVGQQQDFTDKTVGRRPTLTTRRGNLARKKLLRNRMNDEQPQDFTDKTLVGQPQGFTDKTLVGQPQGFTDKTLVGHPQIFTDKTLVGQPQGFTDKTLVGQSQGFTDKTLVGQPQGFTDKTLVGQPQDFTDKTVERSPWLTARRGNLARKELLRNRINADQPQGFTDKTLVGQPQGFTDKTLVGQPQSFTDKTLVGQPQGFTDKTLVGQPQGFTDKTLVSQPQGFTDKTVVGQPQGFTDKTLVGQPQGFTDNTLVGQPQGFTDKTVVGQPQGFTDKTLVGRPQGFTDKTLVGQPQGFTDKTLVGQPQGFTDKTVVGQPQGFTDKTLVGQPQDFTDKTVVGQPQEFGGKAAGRRPSLSLRRGGTARNSLLPRRIINDEPTVGDPQETRTPSRFNENHPQGISGELVERRPLLPSRRGNFARNNLLRHRLGDNKPQDITDKGSESDGASSESDDNQPQDLTIKSFGRRPLLSSRRGNIARNKLSLRDSTDKTVESPQEARIPFRSNDEPLQDFTDKTIEMRPLLSSIRRNLAPNNLEVQDSTEKIVGSSQKSRMPTRQKDDRARSFAYRIPLRSNHDQIENFADSTSEEDPSLASRRDNHVHVDDLFPKEGVLEQSMHQSATDSPTTIMHIVTIPSQIMDAHNTEDPTELIRSSEDDTLVGTQHTEATENVFSNFGKVVPGTEGLSLQNNMQDVFFIGNGIKLPLKLNKDDDGSLKLSVNIDKLCNCKNETCPNAHPFTELQADEIQNTLGTQDPMSDEITHDNSSTDIMLVNRAKRTVQNNPPGGSNTGSSRDYTQTAEQYLADEKHDALLPIKRGHVFGDKVIARENLVDSENEINKSQADGKSNFISNRQVDNNNFKERLVIVKDILKWMRDLATKYTNVQH